MSKRDQSAVIDQSNHAIDAEPTSTQKWDHKEAARILRLVKDKLPELSLALDTATGQIRTRGVEQVHDGHDASSDSALLSSDDIISKALALILEADSHTTNVMWTHAEDQALGQAYEHGTGPKLIQKTLFPQRTLRAITDRLRMLRARNLPMRERQEPLLAPRSTGGSQRARWDWAADQMLFGAYMQGLRAEQIRKQFFPERTQRAVSQRILILKQIKAYSVSTESPKPVKGGRWTAAEEHTLMYARHRGSPIRYILKQFFPERSYGAVRSQLQRIKLLNAEEIVDLLLREGNKMGSGSPNSSTEVSDHLFDSDGSVIWQRRRALLSRKKTRQTLKHMVEKETRDCLGCRTW